MNLGILEPLRADLMQVEQTMRGALEVYSPALAQLLTYVIDHGGKRLRPSLVIMASRFYPVEEFERVVAAAAAIELLHTASLVHDDIVDNALLRRGSATLNQHWGGGTTVLIGDYLLARSASLATHTGNKRLIEAFADTLVVLVEGELREIFKDSSIFSREDYSRRIYAKTASLFAVSAEAGAMLSAAPDDQVEVLRGYGHNFGMAFQIVDDVLDFTGKEGVVGKTVGNDLRQNVVTLPLIYWHETHPSEDRVERILNQDPEREQLLAGLVSEVSRSSAIGESLAEAARYVDAAKALLERLPPNDVKPLMCELANFVIERKA